MFYADCVAVKETEIDAVSVEELDTSPLGNSAFTVIVVVPVDAAKVVDAGLVTVNLICPLVVVHVNPDTVHEVPVKVGVPSLALIVQCF